MSVKAIMKKTLDSGLDYMSTPLLQIKPQQMKPVEDDCNDDDDNSPSISLGALCVPETYVQKIILVVALQLDMPCLILELVEVSSQKST